jgi:hypothetical protein
MRRKTLPQFVAGGAKRRAIGIGNQVIDGEKLAVWFEPAQHRFDVIITFARVYGAKQGVFEEPIKWLVWGVV